MTIARHGWTSRQILPSKLSDQCALADGSFEAVAVRCFDGSDCGVSCDLESCRPHMRQYYNVVQGEERFSIY